MKIADSGTGTGNLWDEPAAFCIARRKGSTQRNKMMGCVKGKQECQTEIAPNGQSWNNLSKKINKIILDYNPWEVKVLVVQSCPTLLDPKDCSPPGSSVHGIPQARILERVAIPFCRGSFWPRDRTHVSCTAGRFFTTWASREALITEVFSGKESSCQCKEMQKTWVRSLGWEDPLEEKMVTYSSTLAWRIPWTEWPGRLQSMGSQKSWTWLSILILVSLTLEVRTEISKAVIY